MWRNSVHGWGLPSILLHWLSAVLVVSLFVLGWWMTGLGYYDRWYQLGPWWHKSLGLTLLGLTLLRLAWRLMQPTPEAHGVSWERVLAHAGHGLLYVLLLTVMVSGYLISTAEGQGISVFGAFEVPALLSDLPRQATLAGEVHWYAAWALVVLAVGHTLAALKHHILDRRDTLRRMWWPGGSRRQ